MLAFFLGLLCHSAISLCHGGISSSSSRLLLGFESCLAVRNFIFCRGTASSLRLLGGRGLAARELAYHIMRLIGGRGLAAHEARKLAYNILCNFGGDMGFRPTLKPLLGGTILQQLPTLGDAMRMNAVEGQRLHNANRRDSSHTARPGGWCGVEGASTLIELLDAILADKI